VVIDSCLFSLFLLALRIILTQRLSYVFLAGIFAWQPMLFYFKLAEESRASVEEPNKLSVGLYMGIIHAQPFTF
jgi:hypothetical protein